MTIIVQFKKIYNFFKAELNFSTEISIERKNWRELSFNLRKNYCLGAEMNFVTGILIASETKFLQFEGENYNFERNFIVQRAEK